MNKQEKALYAQLTAAITALQNPKTNPAQDYLSTEAINGANWLKGGDYRSLPKGMFFNFSMPQQDIANYKKLTNVGQGGTFALANNGGRSQAQGLQGQYLGDKFARDRLQGFQDNISGASNRIQGALGQAAGAQSQNQNDVINALQGMYSRPQKQGGGVGGVLMGLAPLLAGI